mmetsp:Transcript_25249/g.53648  ORF Transcript_25249/g.53648 Transcript_25249/m.53648 type:complete len:214 (-) Transcript_25249:60-701(-)|eukprot:CAMPEP_0206548890 /NCGR_PEP_ID=MMETSP0325_2-20121206/14145_1 /ASSEMBLY_ACC=CAM_ASM_000347 /TAXON_ID=2866 /ORGANISM="Crypthecodinium cohnii, Strain Seligo" /LENGTH=213 /DNA_ID=CAMNT_0054048441 /DNA_START=84 /DNA_END=725 /DNA_ORIENTATION=-
MISGKKDLLDLLHNKAPENELLACLIDDVSGRDPLEDAADSQAHQRDKDRWTPLHWAASEGHERLVSKLLALHVAVNSADTCGATPLMIAAFNGHIGVVDALLQDRAIDVRQGNNYLSTAVHYAAQAGHSVCVRQLINASARVDAPDRHGDTPLGWAARYGHVDAVKMLCEMRADLLKDNNASEDPLELASAANQVDVVEVLEALVAEAAAKQ